MIELTPEQNQAVNMALESIHSGRPLFRIGGFAGTGKTTISRYIVDNAPGGAVCAFTGKAASVLRSKGLPEATTIHKRIYSFDPSTETFHLKNKLDLSHVKYFLLDEASMVNKVQWQDMQSFGKPIIAVGDPGQLEPVGDDPRLMHDADIVLQQIHRQAEGSAIIQFATHVRHGGAIKRGVRGEVQIGSDQLFWDSLDWADVLLCGFNKTRVLVNKTIRERRLGAGAKKKLVEGETIVCLRNSRKLGINNGELFTVEQIYKKRGGGWECEIVDCDGTSRKVFVSGSVFGVAKPTWDKFKDQKIMYADYGYCLSVHKFQGSEADKVAVMDEQCDLWCSVRWRYTAITRSAKELRYAI